MELGVSPLFHGLETDTLNEILSRMRPRRYAAGEPVCLEGAVSDRLYLIESGVVEVVIGAGSSARSIARLRRGDIFGEMGLLADEPRSATILPVVPVQVLELDRPAYTEVIKRHPTILLNIARVLARRQQQSLRAIGQLKRDDFSLLLIGRETRALAQDIIANCRRISPHGIAVVDLSGVLRSDGLVLQSRSVASVMELLEGWAVAPRAAICVSYCSQPDIAVLMRYVDRVALLGSDADLHEISSACAQSSRTVDFFRIGLPASGSPANDAGVRELRTLGARVRVDDLSWIARHLTRTKIGLALGAGGAKGFAHIGVIEALEEAGHVVDFVAGSSIGALIGALMGLGLDAREVARRLGSIWSHESVRSLGELSPDGSSIGLERILGAVKRTFGDRRITDLCLPLSIVTADLAAGEAVPLRNWLVHEAIRAALAIPGLAQPYRHGRRRLIDAVCLMPVPARCVREMGADIVISVNLLSRATLAAWPGAVPPMPAYRREGARNLDPVIETFMMLQTDASIRSAAEADIILTPVFAPSSWRDIHLAEPFQKAGLAAAKRELPRFARGPRAPIFL
jgi:NTE family protein